jgi:hypothetical protein
MAYNMKNSALKMSAKTGSPMQGNYASPMKQWWNPLNKEVKSERVDEDMDDGGTHKVREYKNKLTGRTKTKVVQTDKDGNVTSDYKRINRKDGSEKKAKHKMTFTNKDGNQETVVNKTKSDKEGVETKGKYTSRVTDKHGKTTKEVTKVKGKKGIHLMS